jgi:hypothetical protein
MSSKAQIQAYSRGIYDADRDRPPIFRSTTSRGIVAEIDDELADEWSQAERSAYLEGYYGEKMGSRERRTHHQRSR